MSQNKHEVYFHNNFYKAFIQDVRNAKDRIIIHSPFMRLRRIKALENELRLARERGVVICVFVGDPVSWNQPQEDFEECVARLRKIDVHVNVLDDVHEKLAVIDDNIFWEGSLNILSYYKSSERMTKWYCWRKTHQGVRQHQLDRCKACQQRPSELIRWDTAAEFGRFVARERKKQGYTQRTFAEAVGLDRKFIAFVETGRCDPSTANAKRIIDQLGHELCAVRSAAVARLK